MGLTTLLPGLRVLRTPLAAGVPWVLFLWVVLGDRAGRVLDGAGQRLDQLDAVGLDLDSGALLAGVSFVASLLGSLSEGIAPWIGVPLCSAFAGMVGSPSPGPTVLGRPWCRRRGMDMSTT